jgi:hypothetical protein
MNLYGYVGGDPINGRDPFGLQEDIINVPGYNQMSGMGPPVPADIVVTGWGCNWLCRQQAQAEHYASLMQEQIARAREMVSDVVNSTAFSYVTEGVGWALVAVDVADTVSVLGAGPDAGLLGAPMILSAKGLRTAARGSTAVLGDLSIAAGQRGAIGTIFKTSHYASRLEAAGVNVARAEAAVGKEVAAMRANMATNADVVGRLHVDDVLIEYRTRLLPDGSVSIGTIFPVK